MAQPYELSASVRERVGKGAARALRREGKIPAVIYGNKQAATPISIPLKETNLLLHSGGFLTNIGIVDVDGKKVRIIAKDYQLEPVRDFLLHVDFLRVSAGTRVTVEIPVRFENEETCPGIKRGGVLNVVRYAVEVDAPADSIPDVLIADLEGLELGDSLHISAISLPEGVEPTIRDRDFTVATIATPAGYSDDSEDEAEEEDGEEEVTETEE